MSPNEFEAHRVAKLRDLQSLGVDPYGARFPDAMPIAQVLASFQEESPCRVRAAGRISLMRAMGKATFAHIKDRTGSVQVFFQLDRLGEEAFRIQGLLELGDLVGVEGELRKTRTGEITIFVDSLQVLAKALLSPPEKWHGLRDSEIRYRRRYVDLFANQEVLDCFMLRFRLMDALRSFLSERGFLEVETPMMQAVPGGAAAKPFITHHNTLDMDLYLRVAPELYLKRLLVGGLERVFEVGRNFRNEGIDRQHNPEFTSVEVYQAYADYTDMMALAESLVRHLAAQVDAGAVLPFGEHMIDYASPFRRVSYAGAFEEANGFPMSDRKRVLARAAEMGLEAGALDYSILVDRIFEASVEEKIVQPTFIMDYPSAICPLTRPKAEDPDVAERWDLLIAGMEIGPAYSELSDPQLQQEKFCQQLKGLDEEEATMRTVDADFIRALAYGMPPAGGMGLGIDRLVMLMANKPGIREVILFPLLRPEEGDGAEG